MRGAEPLRCWVWRGLALGCAGLLLVGCSYSAEEPGLLRPTSESRGGSPTAPVAPPTAPSTNPELPVLADGVWTSADGLGVQVRIAIHAVRRISGATVLDWSLTPIEAPNLQPGDPVPPTLDLGLSRPTDELPRIYLLDTPGGRLYRPLANGENPLRCVCTPLPLIRDRLRIGHTTMVQVAFAALPGSRSTVDVAMATMPPFGQLPVTPAGQVPVAVRPSELGRRQGVTPVSVGASDMFRYGPGEQVFRLRPSRVLASGTFTTLEWTIWSVTGGAGLDAASTAPFAEQTADGVERADRVAASGPVLILDTGQGQRNLRTRLVESDPAGSGAPECLCSPLQGWTSVLRRPDKPVTVVTTYPPLPAGMRRVQVRFEGQADISMPVTPAPDARSRAGGVRPWSSTTWRSGVLRSGLRSGPGWSSQNWPTPVPAEEELPDESTGPSALLR